jgi:hypothetical protein
MEEAEIVEAAEALLRAFGTKASSEAFLLADNSREQKRPSEASFWKRVAVTTIKLEALMPSSSIH